MKEDVRRHLEIAQVFLAESAHLLAGGFARGTVGRAYYAMFHAATAVLLDRDIERTSHHGIISAFGEYVVKPDLVPAKLHKHFVEAFSLRSDSDYLVPFEPQRPQAEVTLERARQFVEACEALLRP
jgi:uncharacterized protein (UPF0332 family)